MRQDLHSGGCVVPESCAHSIHKNWACDTQSVETKAQSSLAPRNIHLNPCPGFNSEAGKGIQKVLCVGRLDRWKNF